MNLFLHNLLFRRLSFIQWVSAIGDTIFYLAFMDYASQNPAAKLAIFLISLSEVAPQVLQIFTGVLADFQNQRIQQNIRYSFIRFLLYFAIALLLSFDGNSIWIIASICFFNFISDSLSFYSGAMLTPIFLKIVGEDISEAMGFRQATVSLVRTASNVIGAIIIVFLPIHLFAFLNALTFLLAFFLLLASKSSLLAIEDQMEPVNKRFSIKEFFKHLSHALKVILSFKDINKLLIITAVSQALTNVVTPISALILIQSPFLGLKTGQSLAILAIFSLLGLVLGNILSNNIFKNLATKHCIYLSFLMEALLILGILTNQYSLVLLAALGDTFSFGLTSPRLMGAIFSAIPEESSPPSGSLPWSFQPFSPSAS